MEINLKKCKNSKISHSIFLIMIVTVKEQTHIFCIGTQKYYLHLTKNLLFEIEQLLPYIIYRLRLFIESKIKLID
jgi:hypothetical protein